MTDDLEDRDLKTVTRNRPNSDRPVWTEPYPRRVRAVLDGVAVVDSTRALLLLEAGHLPVYYFPPQDVRTDLLEATDTVDHCPHKGQASYWSVTVGDRVATNALWSYQDPLPERNDIKGYLAFYWHRMEAWFEEDEEVFVHPRDPYHRVDVLSSSRHVRVVVGRRDLAETRRPWLLFETGLPARYYLPKVDVRMDLFDPTDGDPVPLQGQGPLLVGQGRRHRRGRHRLELPVPDPRVPQDREPGRLLQRASRHQGRRRAPAEARDALVAAAGPVEAGSRAVTCALVGSGRRKSNPHRELGKQPRTTRYGPILQLGGHADRPWLSVDDRCSVTSVPLPRCAGSWPTGAGSSSSWWCSPSPTEARPSSSSPASMVNPPLGSPR